MSSDNIGPLIWNTSPNLYYSLKASGASDQTMRQTGRAAYLWNKHRQFIELPNAEARTLFSSLPEQERQDIVEYMGEQSYSRPRETTWQKLKATTSDGFVGLINAFDKYTRTQTNWYRAANLARSSEEWQAEQADINRQADPTIAGAFTARRKAAASIKDQWDTTYEGEQYFDKDKEKEVEDKYSPAVSRVAKLVSMKKLPQEIMAIVETPEEEKALEDYYNPKTGKQSEVHQAVIDYDNAKVSPGRDLAYGLRRFDKKSKVPDVYDIVSGTVDAAFVIGTDPMNLLFMAGAARRVALFGLTKYAGLEGAKLSQGLEKMFRSGSVRRYWDDVGSKVNQYSKAKDLATRGQIAATISKDFGIDVTKRISDDASQIVAKDFIGELAKAGVKDADSALAYFKNAGVMDLIMMGKTASTVEPLMPRKTIISSLASNLRNTTATMIGLRTTREVPKEWNEVTAFASNFANPQDLKKYRSAAGFFNRVFTKVASGKGIKLDTAESAEDVFRLSRLIVDPYFANIIKQAWREADAGTRLRIFDGIALNVGKKFGLSDESVKELYSRTGRQLYSEDMTVLSQKSSLLGKAGNLGRRTGLTEKQLASTSALTKGALADLNQQLKDVSTARKETQQRLKDLKASGGSAVEIQALQDELDNLAKKSGGIIKQRNFYRNATGDAAVKDIRESLVKSGVSKEDAKLYVDILRRGVTEEVDDYQFQQILGSVYDSISNNPVLVKKLSKNQDGIEVLDWDLVQDFVRQAFPDSEEVAERIGKIAYNPAQLGDSQYALGFWQLDREISLPNFVEWSRKANTDFLGTNRWLAEKIVNGWSWLTLVPRLGIRSAIEELGLFGIAVPFGDLHRLIIGKKISTEYRYAKYGEAQLGFINRILYSFFRTGDAKITPAQRKLLQEKPELMPEVIAKNVTKSKAVMFFTRSNPEVLERWVTDFFSGPYGYAALDDINEGAIRSLNLGEDKAERIASKMHQQYGPIADWNIDVKEATKNLKNTKEFDSIRQGDAGFDVNWLTQIKLRLDPKTNLGWGKIVLANIYNQDKAVKALVANFEKYPDVMKRFAIYEAEGAEAFALRMYQFVAHPFTKSNGLLNERLISKVRRTVIDPDTKKPKLDIDANNLTLKDLDEFDNLARPETVLGNRYIPTTRADNLNEWFKSVQNGGMGWMGRQISVLGREPALFANYQIYRKRLMVGEANKVKSLVDSGMDEVTAKATASRWAGNIAQELSTTRTLQYVDNPTVRTNLAFNMRNVARYYRATEDFYRRAGRLVRFDPLAMVKFRLLMTGLDHSGFIHRDEQGEMYFVYPGDDIIYTAVGVGFRLAGKENYLRLPQPAKLTGRVSMLTPSLDPEAAIPTLSSPISAFSVFAIEQWLPESERMSFRKKVLGKYSVNRTLPQLLLPTSVARIMNMLDSDEQASQYASAVRKADALYAATGIQKEFIEKEMAGGAERSEAILKYNSYKNASARNVVVIRNLLGLVVPASPQTDFGLDVPEWVRDTAGITQLKPQFQELVRQYGNDPMAWDKALYKWTKIFPGKSVYVLTESEKTGVGTVKAAMDAVEWIKDNTELVKKYPEAVRFIVPSSGKYDLEAYTFLQDQGFSEMKNIEKYAFEALVAEDYYYWRQAKGFQDEKIKNATSAAEKRALRAQWDAWSKEYREENPHVQVYLDNMVSNDTVKKEAIKELYSMYQKGDMPNTESNKKIVRMTEAYNEFNSLINSVNGRTDEEVAYRKNLRAQARDFMLDVAGGDEQVLAAYRTLFDPLIGE
jgi:hypothetical protein